MRAYVYMYVCIRTRVLIKPFKGEFSLSASRVALSVTELTNETIATANDTIKWDIFIG